MKITIIILLIIGLLLYVICRKSNSSDNEISYEELLQTPEWKEKRLEILKRDNFKCQWCGSKQQLNVHHKYYLKYPNEEYVPPWKYDNNAFITLCNKCHKRCHKKYPNKVYYTKFN